MSDQNRRTSSVDGSDHEQEFRKALLEEAPASDPSSSRLDYFDSVGSSKMPSPTSATHRNSHNCPSTSNDPPDNQCDYEYRFPVEDPGTVEVSESYYLQRSESVQKEVVCIIAFHLLILCTIDILLQIFLVTCDKLCPGAVLLYNLELGMIVAFPCLIMIILRMTHCFKNWCSNCILFILYSATFALFFFSGCDLLFGSKPAHRDIALILFTLTISFLLFSLYVYSKNSTTCLYLSLVVLTLAVSGSISLLILFPSSMQHLPQNVQIFLAPSVQVTAGSSLWNSYAMALLFALASVALTTITFLVLKSTVTRFVNDSVEDTKTIVFLAALGVLLRIEMFFVFVPYAIVSFAVNRCFNLET